MEALRQRSAAATREEKRSLLTEFAAVSGLDRQSAIRVLRPQAEPEPPITSAGRTRLYDQGVQQGGLVTRWEASDPVCGQRLKALLPALLAALEKTAHSRGSNAEGRVVGVERGDDRSVIGSDAVGGIGSPKTSGTVTPAPRDAAAHLCPAGRSPPDSSVEAAPSKNVAIPERSVRGAPVGDNQLAGRRT